MIFWELAIMEALVTRIITIDTKHYPNQEESSIVAPTGEEG